MKNVSIKKLSLLGLVLTGASAITAAVLPKNEPKKTTGTLVASVGAGGVQQLTCVAGTGACTLTASVTTVSGATSTTGGGVGVRTNTTGASGGEVHNINSSGSPA